MSELRPVAPTRPVQRLGLFVFNDEQELLPFSVRGLVSQDLERLDDMKVELVAVRSPTMLKDFDFEKWAASLDFAVIGGVAKRADGRFDVSFRLFDVNTRSQLTGIALSFGAEQLRAGAHRIADIVSEKLTGTSGTFGSQIAYVSRKSDVYELHIAHYDGQQAQYLLRSKRPIQAHVWSSDASRMAYVSLESEATPGLYLHDLRSGQRRRLADVSEKSALAWSTRPNELTLAESRAGWTAISVIDLDGNPRREVARLAGDAEGLSSLPDGTVVALVHEKGASALYALSLADPTPRRIPVEREGTIISAALLPGGRSVGIVMRDSEDDRLFVLDLRTGGLKQLMRAAELGSLTASPDGKVLAVLRTRGGRSEIVHVTPEGKVGASTYTDAGRLVSLVWGPKQD